MKPKIAAVNAQKMDLLKMDLLLNGNGTKNKIVMFVPVAETFNKKYRGKYEVQRLSLQKF